MTRNQQRQALMDWYNQMVGALAALPEAEMVALTEWEDLHVDGRGVVGTSDWPGWKKYIGPKPTFAAPPVPTPKTPIPAELRWRVWERDEFTCRHCGARRELTADHIIPESKGGPTTFTNLQTLCRRCNSKKGAR